MSEKEIKAIISGFEKLIEERFRNMGEKIDVIAFHMKEQDMTEFKSMLELIREERLDMKKRVVDWAWKIATAVVLVSLGFPKVANASHVVLNIILEKIA